MTIGFIVKKKIPKIYMLILLTKKSLDFFCFVNVLKERKK